jgi:hypothetical protein
MSVLLFCAETIRLVDMIVQPVYGNKTAMRRTRQIIGSQACMFSAKNHSENDLILPASSDIVAQLDDTLEDLWPSPWP